MLRGAWNVACFVGLPSLVAASASAQAPAAQVPAGRPPTVSAAPTLPEVVVEPESRPANGSSNNSSNGPANAASSEPVPYFTEPYADGPPLFAPSDRFSPGPADGYAAPRTVSGSKLAIAPLDFPGSVQSITQALIQDQAARTVYDLTRNVSGLSPSIGGSSNRTDDLLLRGFRVQGNSDDFRKNGFRDSSRVQRDMANIDRIEVLKGPAAAIYGSAGEPAGLVNFLTKQPLAVRQDSVTGMFGSWDDYRFTLDSTGPLLDERFAYRLNVAAQNSDSFRDFVFDERYFVAPVVRWRLGDDTTLTVEGEYLRDRRTPDRGVVLYQGSLTAVPRNRFLGEPTDLASFQDGQVSAILDHAFDDVWSLRTGWTSNWSDEYRDQVDTQRLAGGGASSTLQRRRNIQDAKDQNHYWIGDLTGDVGLLGVEHQLLFGSEIGVTARDDFNLQGNAPSINILNPVYGLPLPTPGQRRTQDFANRQYGVYVQDMIELSERWKALLGVRQTWVDAESIDTQVGPAVLSDSQSATTPRFGLVYQAFAGASLYAAYGQSFQPVVGRTRLGAAFSPETGESYELGMKFELVEQRLWATLAGFDSFRRNILVVDPVDANFLTPVGEAESKGVEFDLAGRVTDAWSVVANAAYVDARVTRDSQASLLGKRLDNVPYFGGSLWTRYNLRADAARTTGVGLGWIYVGDRAADAANSFELPSYSRWDAALYHRIQALRLSLHAENLFDAFYIASSRGVERNMPGAPFALRGVAEIRY